MAEEGNENQAAQKKVPLKMFLIFSVVLMIEGVAISLVFLLSSGPEPVKADGAAMDLEALAEQPVEVLVIADKFQNTRTGRSYLYDTEVYIVIRQKYQEDVESDIETKRAQITADIATIFRRAEPAHLREFELATLRRQIEAALKNRLKPAEDNTSVIEEVLIGKCTEIRADF